MTYPTVDDFPVLGFVPCPGDHATLQEVVKLVKHTAEALSEIDLVLRGAAKGEWRGKAATAFRELLADDFRPKVHDAYMSFDLAKRALTDWSEYMQSHQKRARDLEREAAEAQRAQEKEKSSDGEGKPTTGKQSPAKGEDDPVENVRRRARTLHQQYEEEGRRIASRLKKASDIAPNEPGAWDKLTDAVGDALKTIAWAITNPTEMLAKIAPLLKVIGDIAGFISPILGLMALVPGLQWLAGISLVLGAVALVSHYLSAVGKTGSFLKALTDKDVILDAVGLAVGIGALKVGAKVMAQARAAGAVRTVPQHTLGLANLRGASRLGINATEEMPMGYFQLGRDLSYNMTGSDMAWRGAQYFTTWTGHTITAMGTDGLIETGNVLFTGATFGPLVDRSPGDGS
ncbi:hypothetical protein N4P33_08975 [Streptomyces sp. 15-116A]|uniref:putative T7SS-secreted protein n=1 Tax=Streptomyces sp. 15-116A TaxID=2259035 RepID=UPI0021B1919B|nr:hypothetical protein [Streptomyces sp. 15-116A]MCT7352307.1 hypothetical protein [Streptomyces sp. 15-116A]